MRVGSLVVQRVDGMIVVLDDRTGAEVSINSADVPEVAKAMTYLVKPAPAPLAGHGPLMECGCAAQGVDGAGNPVCLVHFGLNPGATMVDTDPPDFSGRRMVCSYRHGRDGKVCDGRANPPPSNPSAAFFKSRPDEEFDSFYDGCWGWD